MTSELQQHLRTALTNPNTQAISIGEDYQEFDTHNTGGEHALKESGSWQSFLQRLEETGGSLPPGIEDPFDYYLQSGRGQFTRVYPAGGGPIFAGMAISASEGRSLVVDAAYCKTPEDEAEASFIASGVRRMLQRNIIQTYCGVYGLPWARQLDLPFCSLGRALQPHPITNEYQLNWSLLRGFSDYSLATADAYRIPLPGFTVQKSNLEMEEDELKKLKAEMPEDFVGILHYSEAGKPEVIISEFYRQAQNVGRMVVTLQDYPLSNIYEAYLANGTTVDVPDTLFEDKETTQQSVRALKLFAEEDSAAAELILA